MKTTFQRLLACLAMSLILAIVGTVSAEQRSTNTSNGRNTLEKVTAGNRNSAFGAYALRDNTRGTFKFNNNHFPIQNIYLREAVNDNGNYVTKTLGVVLSAHGDAYAKDCPMKW